MNIQHYTAIAIRLASLLLLLYALRLAAVFISDISSFNLADDITQLYLLGSILLTTVTGLICWFLPMTLARLIVKPVWDTKIIAFNASALLRVMIILLGLYFVLDALLDIARFIFQMSFNGTAYITSELSQRLKAAYAVVTLQMVIGLFLVMKNFWISQSLLKINAPEINTDLDR